MSQYNASSHPELWADIRMPNVSKLERPTHNNVRLEIIREVNLISNWLYKGKKFEIEGCLFPRSSARQPQLLQLSTSKGRNHALCRYFYLHICLTRSSRPFLDGCSRDKSLCNGITGSIPQVVRQNMSRRVLQPHLYSSNVNFNIISSYKLPAPGKQCLKSLAVLQYPAVQFRHRLVSLVPVLQQPLRIEDAITTKLQCVKVVEW
jgi:hypothetical protein